MSLAPRAPREFATPILSESTHTRVRNSFGAPSTEKSRCYSRECTNMGVTNSFGARSAEGIRYSHIGRSTKVGLTRSFGVAGREDVRYPHLE